MRGLGDTDTPVGGRVALVGFFLLTFGSSWTAWLAVELAAPASLVFAVGGPVFLLGVFAPGLVALALTAFAEGSAGVVGLLARIGRWQVSGRLYSIAIGYMAATKLLAALTHRIVVGEWPMFGDTPLALMAGAILVSTLAQAGEEVGWRGHALPRLATHLGFGSASVLLGVIWALWHLPLFIMQSTGSDRPVVPDLPVARDRAVGGDVLALLEDAGQSPARHAHARRREQHDRHRSRGLAICNGPDVLPGFIGGLGDRRSGMGRRGSAAVPDAWSRYQRAVGRLRITAGIAWRATRSFRNSMATSIAHGRRAAVALFSPALCAPAGATSDVTPM